jgi:RHS repeat-associated protein
MRAVQSNVTYIWCSSVICEERTSDGATVLRRSFRYGEERSGAIQFLAKDRLGSVTEVINQAGVLLARYEFDPWGRRNLTSGADVTSVGFTGHGWDASSTLWITQHRGYDPMIGRWWSEDPVGLRGDGPNLYAYVLNNPIRAIDATGLKITCSDGLTVRTNIGVDQMPPGCRGAQGCTGLQGFQFEASDCYQSADCKWKFDGAVRAHIEMLFAGTPDQALLKHEQGHLAVWQGFCRAVESPQNEGFSSKEACDTARDGWLQWIRQLVSEFDRRSGQLDK